MEIERNEQAILTIEELDRELIAKGAQTPFEELFKFEDEKGTPARVCIMSGVKELYAAASSSSTGEEMDSIDTWTLARTLINKTGQLEDNRERGIWYDDHRMDYFGISDKRIKKNADCTAAIMLENNLTKLKNGNWEVKVKNYGEVFNLCELERFRDQPVSKSALCTGFLVEKNIVATAAHFANENNVTDLRIVFGYRMSAPTSPVIQVPEENIYKGGKITRRVYRRIDRNGDGTDFALVQLDREVDDREIAKVSGKDISAQQPVYVIGYPAGLPLKYAPGAKVRSLDNAFFSADLDIYMGNSGSPVFDAGTHEVIGMVVRGDTRDFRWTGKGWASVVYPHRSIKARVPQCTMASKFSDYVRQTKN